MNNYTVYFLCFVIFSSLAAQAMSSESVPPNAEPIQYQVPLSRIPSGITSNSTLKDSDLAKNTLTQQGLEWLIELRHGNQDRKNLINLSVDKLIVSEEEKHEVQRLVKELMREDQATENSIDSCKQIISLLKNSKLFFSPYLYKAKNANGTIVYLLGSCHIYSLEDINPFAFELIKNLRSCWLEVSNNDKDDTQRHYDYMVRKNFTSCLENWFPQLSENSQHNVQALISCNKIQYGVDLSIMHPLVFYHALEDHTVSIMDLIDLLEYEGMDFSIERLFKNASHHVSYLEDQQTRYEDCGRTKMLEAGIRDVDLATAAKMINDISNTNQSDSYAAEVIKGACLEILLYHFNVRSVVENADENEEMVNRNKRWWPVLDKAFTSGKFEKSSMICGGVAHLGKKTGLLNYFIQKGFSIFRMDKDGQFTINVRREDIF